MNTISVLFKEEPIQWGLRGDPYLWQEMSTYFDDQRLPDNSDELKSLLQGAFQSLTNASIDSEEDIYLEKYSHGGMSSGYVSPEFWRNTAFPLLVSRYESPGDG